MLAGSSSDDVGRRRVIDPPLAPSPPGAPAAPLLPASRPLAALPSWLLPRAPETSMVQPHVMPGVQHSELRSRLGKYFMMSS